MNWYKLEAQTAAAGVQAEVAAAAAAWLDLGTEYTA
jgi:hypothetical protein